MGMLEPTILGALPAVGSWAVRLDLDLVLPAWDEVELAGKARDPERMDHVRGFELDQHGHADRDVDLVRSREAARGRLVLVLDLPPPLATRHLQGHCAV